MKAKILLSILVTVGLALVLPACSDDPAGPDNGATNTVYTYSRDDFHPEGNVVETDDGFTVDGELTLDNEEGQTKFENAVLDVRFDENGRVKSVSGTVQIPAPSDDVSFKDPLQADVGFFRGDYLNQNRDFPILLKDEIEYFVFHVSVAVGMTIRDSESGSEAEISIGLPVGGTILMIMDYNDPMYFVYGQQDLLGAYGHGWSFKGQIPYVPIRGNAEIFTFDGGNVRTGTFTLAKVFSANGTVIEGSSVGFALLENPIEPVVEAGYDYGINGTMDLSLPVKDIVEFSMPLAEASAAVRGKAATNGELYAAAFVDGLVDPDLDWWPDLIPIKPDGSLLTQGIITSDGQFDVHVAGDFGIESFGDSDQLAGDFHLTAESLTLEGAVVKPDARYEVTGVIDDAATTVSVEPPFELTSSIESAVSAEIEESIAEAEQAWEDLQEATENYEFELSLRGLRPVIPGVVDAVKSTMSSTIKSKVDAHKGKIYYDDLKTFMASKDDTYYNALNNLKARAQSTTDSAAWRSAMESALRTAAGYEYFDETYQYKVLGQVVKSVHIRIRILSSSQVSQLVTAANNVKYIKETSDIMIQAQDIYDHIPDKEIFERVRENLENGTSMIPEIGEIGYVQPHLSSEIEVFAMIDGEREVLGTVNIFDLPEMSAALAELIVKLLSEV